MNGESVNATENASGRTPRGERLKQVFDYLNQERVDRELLFTAEHAEQLKQRIGLSLAHTYTTLQRLEKKNLITRKKLAKGKGILITFVSKTQAKPDRNGTKKGAGYQRSIEEIRLAIEAEIAEFEAQIERKKRFLVELESYMKES